MFGLNRLKAIKNLILNKLDNLLSDQASTRISLERISSQIQVIADQQKKDKILLEQHHQNLEKVNNILRQLNTKIPAAVEKSALSSKTLVNVQPSPATFFQNEDYQRINQRRLEHLASLGLSLSGSTVLEVGAGIGDHTSFFLDRRCRVVSTEARAENLAIMRSRFPQLEIRHLDLDSPDPTFNQSFDIIYCYGLLYHLRHPDQAIAYMAERCHKMLLLETCVSFGEEAQVNLCEEPAANPTQSVMGMGCRPTRIWVYQQLKQYFDYVYLPLTQPNHPQFPLEWNSDQVQKDQWDLVRAVFIASRQSLTHLSLTEDLVKIQVNH